MVSMDRRCVIESVVAPVNEGQCLRDRFRQADLLPPCRNGPEFTCRAFIAWAQSHGVQHILIQPERPMQNGYIESFNGKFRDECLNEHWFETLAQARTAIAAWRQDYNEVRPHTSLGRILQPSSHETIAQRTFRHRLQAKRSSNLQPGLPPCDWYCGRGQVTSACLTSL